MNTVADQPVFEFAGFRLDAAQRRLYGPDGQPIPLAARAYDTLLYLLEHSGALLDKDRLMQAVWPNVIVAENNLNQAMTQLRRALGEGHIVTVTGRGYQFVTPVQRLTSIPPAAERVSQPETDTLHAPAAAPLDTPVRRPAPWLWAGAVALAILLLAVVGLWDRTAPQRVELYTKIIPRIEQAIDGGDWEAAYKLTQDAQVRVPGAPEIAELWKRFSWRIDLSTEPAGAKVYRRAYEAPADQWEDLGTTPIKERRIPFGMSRLRLEREGCLPLERLFGSGILLGDIFPTSGTALFAVVPVETYKLDTASTLPKGKVRVPG